jgi:hypothetical protein
MGTGSVISPPVSALQTTILAIGTVLIAVSGGVIAWRGLRPSAEGGSIQTWRDLLGLLLTLAGLAVLVTWLWASR